MLAQYCLENTESFRLFRWQSKVGITTYSTKACHSKKINNLLVQCESADEFSVTEGTYSCSPLYSVYCCHILLHFFQLPNWPEVHIPPP